MRRQFLMATVGAIALAGPAFAADLPIAPPPAPYVPPYSWTGLYLGGQVGYGWGDDPTNVFVAFPGGPFIGESISVKPQGVIGGVHVGYNLQIGQWVAGLEGTVDGTSLDKSVFGAFSGLTVATNAFVQGSIRLRAGFAWDRLLIYATGGAAFTGIHDTYTDPTGFVTGAPGASEVVSRTRAGWTVGGGLAYALTDNWSIRAEYRYSDFGHTVDTPFAAFVTPVPPVLGGGSMSVQHHLTENQVQAGLTYKFNSFAPAPVVAKY